tara:strand:+ start:639 stop:827 length:189 start_codon:yes stop_codon:yes gene_type:complete
MAHHIQKTIRFNNSDLNVYYQSTTHNDHHVWTDNVEESKSFSLENADSMAKTISEATTIIEQ